MLVNQSQNCATPDTTTNTMAYNHVPNEVPLPNQGMYNEPSPYQSSVAWGEQLSLHAGAPPNNPASSQQWPPYNAYPQQPYNSYNQSYASQPQGFQTHAPPYTNGSFNQQGPPVSYQQPSNVDPSLGHDANALRQQQQSQYSVSMRTSTPQIHSGTVTPQALQHNTNIQNARPAASHFQVSFHWKHGMATTADTNHQAPRSTSEMFAQRAMPAVNVKPVPVPSLEIPRGKKSGGLYVLDQAALAKATKSSALNKLVTLGSEPFHLPTNRSKPMCPKFMLRNAHTDAATAPLPLYTPRQSVRELKKVGADNKKLLAKLSSTKPSVAKALKTRTYAASPSELKREISESDSETDSSDDDSEYTDDEDDEISPLPASRPEEPHQAVRYDIIKATWCPRDPPPNTERIKAGMRDIWEVLNTITKRWRADTKAVSDAEAENKTGELPVLKSRVASQRDLLQSALEAAIDHAHPDILFQMGQIKPFVYSCYQFLANRFRSKDFDGPLSAVIFEVLSQVGTLSSELLEETKLVKALTSMKKHANDKHKALIQKIIDGAAANTKKAKASPPPTESKGAKRSAPDSASRPSDEESIAKKPRPNDGAANATKKTLVASANPKVTIATSKTMLQKRPMATAAPVKARVNQVTNKPSGIFASLNAASKKPVPASAAPAALKAAIQPKAITGAAKDKKPAGATTKPAFSFAQTMASLLKPKEQEVAPVKTEKQLPAETPEEKAKRLRKEGRRHLRVTFKPDAALVQIKYFSHDPEEELGHEENFTRHAGDIEGEGRMFKQHKELEEDEDEEEGEREVKLIPWRGEPSQVDFSLVPHGSRESNYTRYGGGEKIPSCPEREAGVRRENATLMVFYAESKDVPPSPREPPEEAQNAAPTEVFREFGTPPDRLRGQAPQGSAPAQVAVPDFSSLESMISQIAKQTATTNFTPAAPQLPPAAQAPYMSASVPNPATDLASILSALQPNNGPPQSLAPALYPMPPSAQQFPPMPAGPLPPNFDLQSIMQGMALGGLPPPPGFPPFLFAPPPQQQNTSGFQSQQQPQYNGQSNGGVKRQREETNNNDWGQGKKHKHRGDRPHKVLPCKFFQKGTCNKGDNCTYVHDLNM